MAKEHTLPPALVGRLKAAYHIAVGAEAAAKAAVAQAQQLANDYQNRVVEVKLDLGIPADAQVTVDLDKGVLRR